MEELISRQATLDAIIKGLCIKDESYLLQSEKVIYNVVKNMPPVTPTHSTCKDCKHCEDIGIKGTFYCKRYGINHLDNYYCADFEKRGNKVGWSSLENVRVKVERGDLDGSN